MKLGIILVLLLATSMVTAKTHIITFPGSGGSPAYNPVVFEMALGDTVRWQADNGASFAFHPLTSSSQFWPGTVISCDTGTVFEYVPTAEGVHAYYCLFHGSPGNGMAGGFNVGASSVKETKLAGVELFQNVPNPAFSSTTISFDLAQPANLTLRVYTLAGKEVAALANGNFGAGINVIPFNTTELPSGIYMYRLSIDGEAITRQLIVTK